MSAVKYGLHVFKVVKMTLFLHMTDLCLNNLELGGNEYYTYICLYIHMSICVYIYIYIYIYIYSDYSDDVVLYLSGKILTETEVLENKINEPELRTDLDELCGRMRTKWELAKERV